ncbi:MAG TPA: amino acid permease [Gemmatimonadales bacterium]|nr:amino acid permease [Gemmatimonadales bacterium]
MAFERRDAWGERLPRRLGLWSAVAVSVGTSIGSGIFRVPAEVAETLGAPGPILVAWVLGGAIAVCGALSFAELAGALPRSGGVLAWILEAFGPLPAFLFAWSELVVLRGAALGAIATIFAEYLGYLAGYGREAVRPIAAVAIVLVGALNYVGIRAAAGVMNPATLAKYAAIGLLGVLAFTSPAGSTAHFAPAWTGEATASLLATALVPVMWTYDGWGDAVFVAGEVRDPARTLPRALLAAAAALAFIYLLVNVAFMYVVPPADMKGAKLIAAAAAERIPLLGGRGAAVVAALVVLSAFSGLNGSMMTGPRVFFGLADQGLFFRPVARVSPRFGTPSVAIWCATLLGVAFVLVSDFRALADRFILGIWPFYALAVGGVFVLRRTRPDLPRPYRTWGYPVVPLLFLLGSGWMMVNALVTDPQDTGITLGVILAGIPVFWAWRRSRP